MPVFRDPLQSIARVVSSMVGRNVSVVNALRPVYENALAFAHGERGIPWSINGVPFRIDPRYRHLMGQTWDPEVAAFLRARVKPGAVCLNVGANAGVYVLQLCHWSAPDGCVIAFEPNPLTREILRRHVRMNGFQDRVEIVPAAISDCVGENEFHFSGSSGMSRLGQPNPTLRDVDQTTIVATTTIDAFCNARGLRPDWLLMDIEGYELPALRGARASLVSCPELQLIVEMHPSLWNSAQIFVTDWNAFFSETGLRVFPLMGQTNFFEEAGSVYLARK